MEIVRSTKLKGTDVNFVASRSAFSKEWCWPVSALFYAQAKRSPLFNSFLFLAVREDRMPGGRNSGAVYNMYKVIMLHYYLYV